MDPTSLTYYAWLGTFLAITALAIFLKDKQRKFAISFLLILSTIFVGKNMYEGFMARAGKGFSASAANRAELPLKFTSGYVAIESYAKSLPGAKGATQEVKKKMYKEANELLQEAYKQKNALDFLRIRISGVIHG